MTLFGLAAIDWGAVAGFSGVAIVVVAALIRVLVVGGRLLERFDGLAAEQRKIRRELRIANRHQDGIMASVWGNTWRMDNVENYLDATTNYRPIVPPIPQVPPRDDDDDNDDG